MIKSPLSHRQHLRYAAALILQVGLKGVFQGLHSENDVANISVPFEDGVIVAVNASRTTHRNQPVAPDAKTIPG